MKETLIQIFADKKTVGYEIVLVKGNRRVASHEDDNTESCEAEFIKDLDRLDLGEYIVKLYKSNAPAAKPIIERNYTVSSEPKQRQPIQTENQMSPESLSAIINQVSSSVEIKVMLQRILDNQATQTEEIRKIKEGLNSVIDAVTTIGEQDHAGKWAAVGGIGKEILEGLRKK